MWTAELGRVYSVLPWQMLDLRRREWESICADHLALQRMAEGV